MESKELVLPSGDFRTPPQKYPATATYGLRPFVKPECLHARSGDLIEIDHTIYAEWGLYIGKGDVILLDGDLLAGKTTRTTVVKRKLAELTGGVLVRVNNKRVPAKNRGVSSLKPKTIIQNVSKLIGKNVEYNILTRNSEHYVTEWKYGISWSDQTKMALQGMTSIFSSTPPSPKEVMEGQEALSESIRSILKTQSSIDDELNQSDLNNSLSSAGGGDMHLSI